jgi:hypothetical protein
MKRVYFPFLALGFLAAQTASAESVICRLDPAPAPHYISQEVRLEVRDLGDVVVEDSVIASSGRERVIGKVSKDDARRLSVVWELRDVPVDPAETRAYALHFLFRLSVQRADGRAQMTIVDTLVREKSYRTTGTCRFGD